MSRKKRKKREGIFEQIEGTTMNENQKTVLKEFLEEEKTMGRREQWLRNLKSRIPKLYAFLNKNGITINQLGLKEAQEYQGFLIATGRKDGRKYPNRTILTYIVAATSFCEYLKRKGLLYTNPFKEIRKIRGEKTVLKDLLKEKEMNHFLAELSHFEKQNGLKNKITQYKVHVIAELMYATGVRISEVAALTADDIDFGRGTVAIREGKQGKSRIAFLNEYTCGILRIYVEKMRSLVFNEWNLRNSRLLFGVKRQWLEKVVNKTLNKTAKEAGYRKLTSHRLRHALGYHLLRAGCNIRHIQQILGHKRLKNTEVYTKVEKEDLKKVLDTFHPRKWKRGKNEETGFKETGHAV